MIEMFFFLLKQNGKRTYVAQPQHQQNQQKTYKHETDRGREGYIETITNIFGFYDTLLLSLQDFCAQAGRQPRRPRRRSRLRLRQGNVALFEQKDIEQSGNIKAYFQI